MTTETLGTAPALAATAPALTKDEIERALLYLEQTRKLLLGATMDLTEAQWTFKPAANRWSIAEIMEHVLFVQERVLGPARDQLLATPASPALTDYQLMDELILNRFPNRLNKFESPLQPTKGAAQGEALDRIARNFPALADYLQFTPDLRAHSLPAFPIKAVSGGKYESMDGYQWIVAVIAHTERHTKQILEVKGETEFPAR